MESDRLVEGAFFVVFTSMIAYTFGRQGWRRALQTPPTYVMLALASLSLPHAVGVTPRWFHIAMLVVASAWLITAVSVGFAYRNTSS